MITSFSAVSKIPASWLREFAAALQAPGAIFPLFDAKHWNLNQAGSDGIGYWLKPRQTRPERLQVWFRDTLAAHQHPELDWQRSEIYAAVYWPRFLAAARSTHFSPMRPLATKLWFVLRKHVALFDQMFADELAAWSRQYAANPEKARQYPLYFGETCVADVKRFDAHLSALLRNDKFLRYLAKVMNGFLDTAASSSVVYASLTCANATCLGSKTRFCEDCRAGKALRWHGSLLRMAQFHYLKGGSWCLPPAKPSIAENTDAILREAAYLMSGLIPEDGAVIETHQKRLLLVVNFETVLQRLQTTQRESLLTEFVTNVPTEGLWTTAHNVRLLFDETLFDCLADPRPPAYEMAQKYGMPWANDFQHSIAMYDLTRLRNRLVREGSVDFQWRNSMLARARAKRSRIKPERQHALVEYRSPSGATHTLKIYPHKKRFFFQTPSPVTEGDYPREFARKFNGQFYFTPAGASRFLRPDAFPSAGHWASWMLATHGNFNATTYRRLRYDNQYATRLQKIDAGEQRNLGRFSTYETDILERWLRARNAPRTPIKQAEWTELLAALPTRTRRSVLAQITKLGKDYALKYGWVAYVNSPYCLQVSSARRRRWAKDGVVT